MGRCCGTWAVRLAAAVVLGLALALPGAAMAQHGSRPTGTQGVEGNPNCPPPVINGITPRNWSCPTGTQRVAPRAATPDPARPFAVDRCQPRAGAPYREVRTVHDLAAMVFDNYRQLPIFIARITNLPAPQSYLLVLSGTQLDRIRQRTGFDEDVLTSLNVRDLYSRAVMRALGTYRGRQGVPDYAHLYVVGHSLGGMVAQNLVAASDFSTRWNPRMVVTLGSPRTVSLPGSLVRRFAAVGDPVPRLSPAAWGLGGFDMNSQTWVDNGVPAAERGNPIAPHMHYPDSQDLYRFDAVGAMPGEGRAGARFVLEAAGQEYCPAEVL